jgi:hypothetical protein
MQELSNDIDNLFNSKKQALAMKKMKDFLEESNDESDDKEQHN